MEPSWSWLVILNYEVWIDLDLLGTFDLEGSSMILVFVRGGCVCTLYGIG